MAIVYYMYYTTDDCVAEQLLGKTFENKLFKLRLVNKHEKGETTMDQIVQDNNMYVYVCSIRERGSSVNQSIADIYQMTVMNMINITVIIILHKDAWL